MVYTHLILQPTSFPLWLSGKVSANNAGDLVRYLAWEDPLEKGKAMHSSGLGEFHGLYSSWGCKESDTTERLSLSAVNCVSRFTG